MSEKQITNFTTVNLYCHESDSHRSETSIVKMNPSCAHTNGRLMHISGFGSHERESMTLDYTYSFDNSEFNALFLIFLVWIQKYLL